MRRQGAPKLGASDETPRTGSVHGAGGAPTQAQVLLSGQELAPGGRAGRPGAPPPWAHLVAGAPPGASSEAPSLASPRTLPVRGFLEQPLCGHPDAPRQSMSIRCRPRPCRRAQIPGARSLSAANVRGTALMA